MSDAGRPPRILILGEPSWFMSAILAEAALRLARVRGYEVVGVCDAGRQPRRHRLKTAREVLAAAAKRALDREQHVHWRSLAFRDLRAVAGDFGVPVLVPPDRNVNHPAFVARVAHELRPDWGLSLACGQIFGPELLVALGRPVNYHNGLLPAYRGVGATSWSLFNEEPVTGFTFHGMTERIDDGPILVDGTIPVPPVGAWAATEWNKTVAAAAELPALFDALGRADPGRPQTGAASYFSAAAWRAIRTIDDPTAHTASDLRRRLRCFLHLTMRFGDERYEVTRLRTVPPGTRPGPLAFTTRDGVLAEPDRFLHLPWTLYRLYRPWWPGRPRDVVRP